MELNGTVARSADFRSCAGTSTARPRDARVRLGTRRGYARTLTVPRRIIDGVFLVPLGGSFGFPDRRVTVAGKPHPVCQA